MTRFFLVLMCVVGMLGFGGDASGQNLLNNSGFEDPLGFDFTDPTNFNGFFGGPAGTFLEAFNDTGAPAYSGAQALELTLDGVSGVTNGYEAFVGQVQTVPGIVAGQELTASVFARNNDSQLTGNVEFRIEFRDGGNAEISREQINLETLLTDNYQEYSFNALAPAGTASANYVLAIASFNQDVLHSNSVLFDNASLTAVIPEPSSVALTFFASILGVMGFRRWNA